MTDDVLARKNGPQGIEADGALAGAGGRLVAHRAQRLYTLRIHVADRAHERQLRL